MTVPLRLQILSDLHRDVRPAEIVLSPDADVLIVAGDICEGVERSLIYLRARVPQPFPIVFVAGNHEFYRHCIGEEIDRGREMAADLGIAFLENEAAVIGGVRFLGCTLWTDYEVEGRVWRDQAMQVAWAQMNDHKLIKQTKEPFRKFSPDNALGRHRTSRAWLDGALAEPFDGPTVVVTHHAPSPKSIAPKYAGHIINAAFASDLDDVIGRYVPALWVHGHTHTSFDYMLGSTSVVANPHGYGDENPEFDPALIAEVDR